MKAEKWPCVLTRDTSTFDVFATVVKTLVQYF